MSTYSTARREKTTLSWLSLLLLTLMLLTVVGAIQTAEWVEHLEVLTGVTLVALLVGLLLALSRLPSPLLHGVGALAGVELVFYTIARTLPEAHLEEQVLEVFRRLFFWLATVRSGGIGTDNLLFLLFLASLAWLMAYWGAWSLGRSNSVWVVIVGAATGLIVNLSYARYLTPYLFFFLLCAMLLVVRQNFLAQERAWRAKGVAYNPGVAWHLLGHALPLLAGVLLLAWSIPLASGGGHLGRAWSVVERPWQEAQNEFMRLFGAIRVRSSSMVSGYGPTLALKGPVSLSNGIVLYLATDKAPRYLRGMVYERYTSEGWVAGIERPRVDIPAADERPQPGFDYMLRDELTQVIKIVQPKGNLLFAASQPLKLSLPTMAEADRRGDLVRLRIDLRQVPAGRMPAELATTVAEVQGIVATEDIWAAGTSTGVAQGQLPSDMLAALRQRLSQPTDLIGVWLNGDEVTAVEILAHSPATREATVLRVPGGVPRGMQYAVVSSVSGADATALRAAGEDYPSWVAERYLPLPRSVPPRVRALARELVRGKTNPYDKTTAVEAYLRRLTYNEQIPPPPQGRDGVDYFLFDLKQGYCDYFATAMAVLLRSVGIPARVVAGYNIGEFDEEHGVYVIRESNSHSWPEVFFPSYGWVEFEPTPSRPTFERAESLLGTGDFPFDEGEEAAFGDEDLKLKELAKLGLGGLSSDFTTLPVDLAGAGVLLIWALVAGLGAIAYLWRRGLAELLPVERTYAKVSRLGAWLGRAPRPAETPCEYSQALAEAVPNQRRSLLWIADSYVQAQFGQKIPSPHEMGWLERAWRSLRWELALGLLRRYIVPQSWRQWALPGLRRGSMGGEDRTRGGN